MIEDLVIIGKETNLTRYDTQIESVITLHDKVLRGGRAIESHPRLMALLIRPPGVGFVDTFLIGSPDLEALQKYYGCKWVDGSGLDPAGLNGKPVRIYYLNYQLVGLEPLDKAKE